MSQDSFTKEHRSIVRQINEFLDNTWSEHEVKHGKIINVFDDWYEHIKPVANEYKKAGWIVSKHVELTSITPGHPRYYLVFKHPVFGFK